MNTYKQYRQFEVGCIKDTVSGLTTIPKAINESQKAEASKVGLSLVARSTDPNYNLYFFNNCGHKQFLQPTHVRRNNVKCKTCQFHSEVEMFHSARFVYLYRTEGPKRKVIKPCGCIAELVSQTIGKHLGKVCKTCLNRDVNFQAKKLNVEILNRTQDNRFTIRFNECGHTRTTHHCQFFTENLSCKQCKEDNYKKEAAIEGLEYVGFCDRSKVHGYDNKRIYRLPCGHNRDLRMSHVRESRWQCDICKDSHFLKPSFVYVVQIDTPSISFIKLGYARDIQSRILCYGLKNASAKELISLRLETGRDAINFENTLHKKYGDFNLPKTITSDYMGNGKTECYPLDLLGSFAAEFENKRRRID